MKKENKKDFEVTAGAMMMFRHTANELEERGQELLLVKGDKKGAGAIVSSAILYAFSCEVGLKALLLKSGVEEEKTHDLEKLFDKLPDDVKNDIVTEVMKDCKGDFTTLIGENKKAFENWRYFYEGRENVHASFTFLRLFSEAIKNECVK